MARQTNFNFMYNITFPWTALWRAFRYCEKECPYDDGGPDHGGTTAECTRRDVARMHPTTEDACHLVSRGGITEKLKELNATRRGERELVVNVACAKHLTSG